MPTGGQLQFAPAGQSAFIAQTGPDIYAILGPYQNIATYNAVYINPTPTAIGTTYSTFGAAFQACQNHYLNTATA